MKAFCRMPYLFVTCRFFFLTSDCVPGSVEDFFCVWVWALKKNTHLGWIYQKISTHKSPGFKATKIKPP